MELNKYYVYQYKDPTKKWIGEVFYVGKGCGKRSQTHLWETKEKTDNYYKWCIIKSLKNKGLRPIIEIIQDNMRETDAYELEISLIQKYGRKGLDNNGILTNRCIDRKPPSQKGILKTEDHKRKIGLGNLGKIHSYLSDYNKEEKSLYWKIMSPKNESYIIKNLREFCRENNLSQAAMWQVANGNNKTHKGWICEYGEVNG